jgi:hypothetical protein
MLEGVSFFYLALIGVLLASLRFILGFFLLQGDYLEVKQSFCPDGTTSGTVECSRPDLFAFQVGSGMAILFCGLMGFRTWHITQTVHSKIPSTPEGRLYGYLPENESIAAAQLVFQGWDFIISLLIPEHCTAIMLCHHTLAALLSWFSLRFQVSF